MAKQKKAEHEVLDLRQNLCWELYINPKSETFNNGLKSAIKAGYSKSHSLTVTTEKWFRERKDKLRREGMLERAEQNIENILKLPYEKNGEINGEALRAVSDMSKTVAKTLGKEHYSERSELTGKNGEQLFSLSRLFDESARDTDISEDAK